MSFRYWGLTSLGKKISGDISQENSDELEIMRALHEGKRVELEEIVRYTTIPKSRVRKILLRLRKKGVAKELTASGGEHGNF